MEYNYMNKVLKNVDGLQYGLQAAGHTYSFNRIIAMQNSD
jgi:hypothetical protein